MRSIWSGGITFALIYIPVNIYSATQSVELDLDMLSKKDLQPIKYARIDSKTGSEVSWKDIVKGYKYNKGDYVVLDQTDFEKVDLEKSKNIEISCFVNLNEIDPIYFDKPYYVEPIKGAEKTYELLVKALKKKNLVGVSQFVLRNREHLCILKAEGDILILNQIRYESEIRSRKDLNIPTKENIKNEEIKLAGEIIDKMTTSFNASEYRDEYIEGLKKLIEAKAHHTKIKTKDTHTKQTQTSDLLEQLKQSLSEIKVKDVIKK